MTSPTGNRGPARDTSPLNVLVVDDSAVVRQIMMSVLSQSRHLKISVAADPIIAMEKMKRRRPDVILLDLMMPRMDGLTFLKKVMWEDPIPVVVCSALTTQGSEDALRALDEGAVDIVGKPKLGVADFLEESAEALIDTIFAASKARLRKGGVRNTRTRPFVALAPPVAAAPETGLPQTPSEKVIAIGASTGGPAALRILLYQLPLDCPGVVIVQHMPEIFTDALAHRLDGGCKIEVKQAAHGDLVAKGRVLIAPGNRHMVLAREGDQFRVHIEDGPRVGRHRPSVDVLFRSVAELAGHKAVAVLLTGMGADGAEGMEMISREGGYCIAQDEATSVVFGMPRQAIARGVVDRVAPLSEIGGAIGKAANRKLSRRS